MEDKDINKLEVVVGVVEVAGIEEKRNNKILETGGASLNYENFKHNSCIKYGQRYFAEAIF